MTRVLGTVLAGGQARRFGGDKAAALLGGTSLIERVIAAITPQVDAVVICGRSVVGHACIGDRPPGGHGPLAGLNAALRHGADADFDAVLGVPCDAPFLPDDLAARLAAAGTACFVSGSPVIGRWPCDLASALDAHLAAGGDRSMRGWAARIGAVPVRLARPVDNVNTPADLARLAARSD